jgi:hypothetical protein
MRVLIAAIILASFAFALKVFVLAPPQAEAERQAVSLFRGPTPCPAPAAKWCHEFGGLAE